MGWDTSKFVSAGFLITREVDRPSYADQALIPDRIVSASGCIAKFFLPDTWCIDWTNDSETERGNGAQYFGLDAEAANELTQWATAEFDSSVRWPNVILDLEVARELVRRFVPSLPDVRIIELALHSSLLADFIGAAEPPPQQPGFAPFGKQGIHETILEGRGVRGGVVLGAEPLVFFATLSCSWLCNELETEVANVLGIKPNRYGLIDTWQDAQLAVEHISRDVSDAEMGIWLPWLLVRHGES